MDSPFQSLHHLSKRPLEFEAKLKADVPNLVLASPATTSLPFCVDRGTRKRVGEAYDSAGPGPYPSVAEAIDFIAPRGSGPRRHERQRGTIENVLLGATARLGRTTVRWLRPVQARRLF